MESGTSYPIRDRDQKDPENATAGDAKGLDAAFGRNQNHHSRKKRKKAKEKSKEAEPTRGRRSLFSSSFVFFGSLSFGLSCRDSKMLRLCSAQEISNHESSIQRLLLLNREILP
jgi:hypothetical protein